jgi:hypothetical protein
MEQTRGPRGTYFDALAAFGTVGGRDIEAVADDVAQVADKARDPRTQRRLDDAVASLRLAAGLHLEVADIADAVNAADPGSAD